MVFKASRQQGFTILELLIAITVFSLSLMIVMAVVIGMGKQYQKASYTAQLNDAARNFHQAIANDVNYSKLATQLEVKNDGTTQYVCLASNIIYAWSLDTDGLYKYQGTACDAGNANDARTKGVNLLPKNSFVAKVTIPPPTNNTYFITTDFRSGTSDMFKLTGTETRVSDGINCLPTLQGGDFCSIVQYNSVVKPRL